MNGSTNIWFTIISCLFLGRNISADQLSCPTGQGQTDAHKFGMGVCLRLNPLSFKPGAQFSSGDSTAPESAFIIAVLCLKSEAD